MQKTITIQVHNRDGDITVSPSLVHVNETDEITWQLHSSHGGKLTLTFADGGAFGRTSLGGQGPSTKAPASKKGIHHYHVKVEVAAGGAVPADVYEDKYCPTVIIR